MTEPIDYENDYADLEPARAAQDVGAELDECVRRNPTGSILLALGVGLILGILARALRPTPKPQHRFAEFMEELEERLRDTSAPAFRKASALASDSAHTVSGGLHRGEAHVERLLRKAASRVRHLWS